MKSIRILLVLTIIAAALAVMGPALAAGSNEQPPPNVKGKIIRNGNSPNQGPSVLGARERGATGALPFTGSELTLFVVAGTAAVGAGTVLVRRSRSRDGA
jgi:hypothetical protein